MKRRFKYTIVALAAMIPIVLWATVSSTPSVKAVVVDAMGTPIEGAFIAYHYAGPKFFHGSYYKAGSLVTTGKDGGFEIPSSIHFHLPFPLQGSPELLIAFVYSSQAHMAAGSIGAGNSLFHRVVADEVSIDPRTRQIALSDARRYPAAWFSSLRLMLNTMHFDEYVYMNAPLAAKRSLFRAVLEDIKQFKQEYAETPFRPTRAAEQATIRYRAVIHDGVVPAAPVGRDTFGDYLDRELSPLEEFAASIGAASDLHRENLSEVGKHLSQSKEEAIRRCMTNIQEGLARYAGTEPLLAGIESIQPEWNRLRFESTVGDKHCVVYIHLTAVPPGGKYQPYNDEGEPQNFMHMGVTGHKRVDFTKAGQPYGEQFRELIRKHLRTMMDELDGLREAK